MKYRALETASERRRRGGGREMNVEKEISSAVEGVEEKSKKYARPGDFNEIIHRKTSRIVSKSNHGPLYIK